MKLIATLPIHWPKEMGSFANKNARCLAKGKSPGWRNAQRRSGNFSRSVCVVHTRNNRMRFSMVCWVYFTVLILESFCIQDFLVAMKEHGIDNEGTNLQHVSNFFRWIRGIHPRSYRRHTARYARNFFFKELVNSLSIQDLSFWQPCKDTWQISKTESPLALQRWMQETYWNFADFKIRLLLLGWNHLNLKWSAFEISLNGTEKAALNQLILYGNRTWVIVHFYQHIFCKRFASQDNNTGIQISNICCIWRPRHSLAFSPS